MPQQSFQLVVIIAALPLVLLGLRAIFGGSTGDSSGNPNPTAVSWPKLATCTIPSDVDTEQGDGKMTNSKSLGEIATSLLAQRDLELVSCQALQSLWAGYGHVCSVKAVPTGISAVPRSEDAPSSFILKYISPPASANISDEGHLRKVLSYQVEQYFYTHLAPQLPDSVAVAECIASVNDGTTTALILKDLKSSVPSIKPRLAFPVALEKRGELNNVQTMAALRWLAGFHGHFWGTTAGFQRENLVRPPLEELVRQRKGGAGDHIAAVHAPYDVKGVWLNGGYTYLATRRNEYASLARDQDDEWSSVLCASSPADGQSLAERVAAFLAPASELSSTTTTTQYETLLHGDVKSENMFASSDGEQVAFVDFQYVGLGLGVCDLAKLFTCSVPLSLLVDDPNVMWGESELSMQPGERQLLLYYRERLQASADKVYPWDVFVRHWEMALIDWLRFQASWGFWGNTKWLEARVKYIINSLS